MAVMKLPNKLNKNDLRIPDTGTEDDILCLALDIKDLIRDNMRHDARTALLNSYKEHDRLYETELDKADRKADQSLPETIRSYVARYLPNPKLSDFQRRVFEALSGFAPEAVANADPRTEDAEEQSSGPDVRKATFHHAGRTVLIPVEGTETDMMNIAIDLKDGLRENLRVEFSKRAADIRKSDMELARVEIESSTDIPEPLKAMMKQGAVGMMRIGPRGPMTLEDEVDAIVSQKLPEAIQHQARIFSGHPHLTPFQRDVVNLFAGFAPTQP